MPDAKQKMKDDLAKIIKANREAFEGQYGAEIKALQGLSDTELAAIIPKGTDQGVYDQLIEVVKDASRKNLSQAALKERIEALGNVAVAIAKTVAPLAKLLG